MVTQGEIEKVYDEMQSAISKMSDRISVLEIENSNLKKRIKRLEEEMRKAWYPSSEPH